MPKARAHEPEPESERPGSITSRRGSAATPPADPPGGPAIQLFSIPGAFDSAIRKIPKVDRGLNKLNANAKVKKAAKVASFLGFKIPFVDRPKPGGDGGGGEGDSECCKSPFPKNRHDASQHDPEANKAGVTPAGPDQTAEPSLADAESAPKPEAGKDQAPADKRSDLAKSREWSEARKLFEAAPTPKRTAASIHAGTKERFAKSRLHHKPEPAADAAESEEKPSVKDRVREARRKQVTAALSGEGPKTSRRSPIGSTVKGSLGTAGVGHQSILASAQQDMHGRQADRFQLHLDAAQARAKNIRPQQDTARQKALGSVAEKMKTDADRRKQAQEAHRERMAAKTEKANKASDASTPLDT